MPISMRSGIAVVPSAAFFTNFSDAPENPISEGGAWHHQYGFNAAIATTTGPNRAVGTQTGVPPDTFNDSYAYLSGFGPNVDAQATVFKDPAIDTTFGYHEVELLFRMVDNASSVRAYECNWSSVGGYQQIVRWDAGGGFQELANFGAFTAPVTGDMVRATIAGGTITTFIKRVGDSTWTQMCQATDNTYADGQPGIGMWLHAADQSPQSMFGFTNYSATGI